jgi:hypothetical protein
VFAAVVASWILLTGEGNTHFVAAETVPKTGWIALYDDALREASIAVRPDDVGDQKMVSVESDPGGALLMLHGVPGITAGPVERARFASDSDLNKPGDRIALRLGSTQYRITLNAEGELLKDARVVLESGDRKQTLFSLDGTGDEPHFEVLWAGDLDRDGKLDLVMTMSGKYSYYPRSIFLSSAAAPGELLHEVARWDDYSC